VGKIDGDWGENTTAAIAALQKQAGITVDGHYGPETAQALSEEKNRRQVSEARANTTVEDVRQSGSSTIAVTDKAMADIDWSKLLAKIGGFVSALVALLPVILPLIPDALEYWEQNREAAEQAATWIRPFVNLPPELGWIVTAGVCLVWYARGQKAKDAFAQVQQIRVNSERSGMHNGEPDPAPSPPVERKPEPAQGMPNVRSAPPPFGQGGNHTAAMPLDREWSSKN
jgi:hypothetical protein